MRTITIVIAAAAALASTIGMARPVDQGTRQSFVHAGSTYVYTTRIIDGRRVIDGRRLPGGSGFHLVVRGDKVSGISGGVPVAFQVARARGASVEVASR